MAGRAHLGILVLAAALLLGAALPAAAGSTAATERVTARLVASAQAVTPGGSLRLGLMQRIIPRWHTYWRNPGDSGLATAIAWNLPDGASAGEILWPAPQRIAVGPLTNYGYEGEVTLLTDVAVSTGARPGSEFPIRATVDWLVCEEICIPEQVSLDLSLPVVAAGADVGPGDPAIRAAEARLPMPNLWPARFEASDGGLALTVDVPGLRRETLRDVWLYPTTWGVLDHGAPQALTVGSDRLRLSLTPGEAYTAELPRLDGVLVIAEDTGDGSMVRAFEIAAERGTAAAATKPDGIGLGAALLFALLGGLILNLMPCVFPVLSMKALALVGMASEAPGRVRLHGLAYALGVLASFAALAGLLVALKAAGSEIGWGFQLQSPAVVLLLAYVLFAVGLNLSGVFRLSGSFAGIGGALAARSGLAGSFFTGVLATVVATPCTAPFMAAAIGFALTAPLPLLFAVFLALGLGLALPYLALSLRPSLLRLLPRPGPWMERLRQFLAFPMYGAAVWLVWVLSQQAGADGVLAALAGMLAVAFLAWLYEAMRGGAGLGRRIGVAGAALLALAVVAGAWLATARMAPLAARPQTSEATGETLPWQPYSAERLAALRAEGRPVFLNFTAAWCITCLVNERVALSRPEVAERFAADGIAYLKGDWTNRDAAITAKLAEFGRSGVPLYVFYPAGRDAAPVVLPQLLTPAIVLARLDAG